MESCEDGSSGGFRSDLVWRNPRPIEADDGQRFVGLDRESTALFDDVLIVQIRHPDVRSNGSSIAILLP